MIARSKISQNDLDLIELESIKLWAGGPGSLFDFSTGYMFTNAKAFNQELYNWCEGSYTDTEFFNHGGHCYLDYCGLDGDDEMKCNQ